VKRKKSQKEVTMDLEARPRKEAAKTPEGKKGGND
jgi:hypothetical protein